MFNSVSLLSVEHPHPIVQILGKILYQIQRINLIRYHILLNMRVRQNTSGDIQVIGHDTQKESGTKPVVIQKGPKAELWYSATNQVLLVDSENRRNTNRNIIGKMQFSLLAEQ